VISIKHNLWTTYAALMVTAVALVWTGLIPKWGEWYSNQPTLRLQTEAMEEGHISLATDPSELGWNEAWNNGKVQQVYGLAVPTWRLPFEWLAKLFGQSGFPDRLTFGLALALLSCYTIRSYALFFKQEIGSFAIVALLTTVLFPAFLALCRAGFSVHEEVVAYGYIGSMFLMFWLARFWLLPTLTSYLFLALACGIIPFIRAPVGIYGFATFSLATYRMAKREKSKFLALSAGTLLYGACGALLLYGNSIRFGSPLEFGYSLNLTNSSAMDYAQRFGSPFPSTPIISAGTELFGALFLCSSEIPDNPYGFGLFPGQTRVFRWRHLPFRTYDLSICIMILTIWAWLAWRLFRFAQRKETTDQPHLLEAVAFWSLLTSIPLVVFYLRFPFIASRYLLDFGPSFASACIVFFSLFFFFIRRLSRNKPRIYQGVPMACMVGWWVAEVMTLQVAREPTAAFNSEEINAAVKAFGVRVPAKIPLSYTNGFSFQDTGIHGNGTGWNSKTGTTKACVSLFVENPSDLVLEVEPAVTNLSDTAYDCIQAKIGLERLKRYEITHTGRGASIRFQIPTKQQYQTGIQLVSIAMMAPQELSTGDSKFLLRSITWHSTRQTSSNSSMTIK